jgi:Resolvase, N terminal domain
VGRCFRVRVRAQTARAATSPVQVGLPAPRLTPAVVYTVRGAPPPLLQKVRSMLTGTSGESSGLAGPWLVRATPRVYHRLCHFQYCRAYGMLAWHRRVIACHAIRPQSWRWPPHGCLMLTVLGGLAEFERELIRARTSEGRARAKARGVKLGRRPKLTPIRSARRSVVAPTANHSPRSLAPIT